MICQKLNQDNISELLPLLGSSPIFLFPFLKNFIKARGGGLVINDLSVFPGDVKWSGDEVGYVLPNKSVGIQMSGVDFFREI